MIFINKSLVKFITVSDKLLTKLVDNLGFSQHSFYQISKIKSNNYIII